MKKITLLFAMLAFSFGFSQTFTFTGPVDGQGPGGGTDATCGTSNELLMPLTVSGIGTLGDVNQINSVTVNITHTWNGDVRLVLVAPDGINFLELITTDVGGSGDGFTNCIFADGGAVLPTAATTPVTGTFAPQGAGGFAALNATGAVADGDWELFYCDAANGDVGVILDWSVTFGPVPACTFATVDSSTLVTNCGSSQFSVEVDVTSVGDAVEVTDGTNTWPISGVGIVTAGPFASGTSATLTVIHSDPLCNINLGAFTFTCPPANNDCANATTLTPGATFEANPLTGSNAGASGSGELPLPGCATYDPVDPTGFGGDVWYSVTVPGDGNLTIETSGNPTGNLQDSGIAVYSGTCGALVLVECDDDDGADGNFSQVVIEPADGLANQVVYVRVWEFGGNNPLNFQVSAYSATLSTGDLDAANKFTYYPNPVKNTLQLNSQSNIQNVSIYNMLGQEVLRTAPNNVNSTVDMSAMQTGAYFVKVTINDRTETIRVIKQ